MRVPSPRTRNGVSSRGGDSGFHPAPWERGGRESLTSHEQADGPRMRRPHAGPLLRQGLPSSADLLAREGEEGTDQTGESGKENVPKGVEGPGLRRPWLRRRPRRASGHGCGTHCPGTGLILRGRGCAGPPRQDSGCGPQSAAVAVHRIQPPHPGQWASSPESQSPPALRAGQMPGRHAVQTAASERSLRDCVSISPGDEDALGPRGGELPLPGCGPSPCHGAGPTGSRRASVAPDARLEQGS